MKMLHNSSFELDLIVFFLIKSKIVTYDLNFNQEYIRIEYTVDAVYSERVGAAKSVH
jgi:hypothetical protein